MLLPTFTKASMLLRTICGLGLIGAALAAGFMLRSPWSIVPLGLAFSVLFVVGKWTAWKEARRASGSLNLLLGVLTVVPVQCMIVGFFYGLGWGACKLSSSERVLSAYERWDTHFALVVLLVGTTLAVAAHILEARADASDDVLRSMLNDDDGLSDEMKKLILDADNGSDS